MKSKYNIWKGRDLSLLGRILIAKSLGISNLVYSLSNSTSNTDIIKEIQKLTNHFIWNNRPPKIKHSTLINDYDKGGLKAPDIQCMQKSLRLVWIGRIIQERKWSTVANYYFSRIGGLSFLLHCNYDTQFLPYIPTFYKEMLSWFREAFPPNEMTKYVIWNNKNILINGKSLFWNNFFEKDITTISQLLNQNAQPMNMNDLKNIYNIEINFLKYHGLFSIISRNFKDPVT